MLAKVDSRKDAARKGLRALCRKHGVPSHLPLEDIGRWAEDHALHDVAAAWRGVMRWEVRTGANIRMPEKPAKLDRQTARSDKEWSALHGDFRAPFLVSR